MQTVGQALESLQNLTNAKISQEEFGKALQIIGEIVGLMRYV